MFYFFLINAFQPFVGTSNLPDTISAPCPDVSLLYHIEDGCSLKIVY
jgi:hypothetical protein